MMPLADTIASLRDSDGRSSVIHDGELDTYRNQVHRVAVFAGECLDMITSLQAVSFPIPGTVTITCGPPGVGDITLTETTARILHAALGSALGVPAPHRLASE